LGPTTAPTAGICSHRDLLLGVVAQNFSLKDPNLDAQNAIGRAGHFGCVINFGAKGVQGHTSFTRPFSTSDFGTIEASADLDFQAKYAGSLSALNGHADCAAEGHAFLELLSDVLSKKECVGIHTFHFNHVDPNLTARITNGLLDAAAEIFDSAALTANQHTGACRFELNLKLISFPSDQHIADAG
jgi:hypothetical protein